MLALGNYSPANPAAQGAEFYSSDRYVRDPWIRGSLDVVRPGESVLMLGTGLTALDIALDLAGRGAARPLRAVSRHGLLPHPHAPAMISAPPPPELLSLPLTARGLMAAVRKAASTPGNNWRGVIGALRGATPGIWQELYLAERSRFLRHVRPVLGRAPASGGAGDLECDPADAGVRRAADPRRARGPLRADVRRSAGRHPTARRDRAPRPSSSSASSTAPARRATCGAWATGFWTLSAGEASRCPTR